jgi:hypothetical protein
MAGVKALMVQMRHPLPIDGPDATILAVVNHRSRVVSKHATGDQRRYCRGGIEQKGIIKARRYF